jgi:hypothetical protein
MKLDSATHIIPPLLGNQMLYRMPRYLPIEFEWPVGTWTNSCITDYQARIADLKSDLLRIEYGAS